MFALSLAVTRWLSSPSCDRTAFDFQTSSCRSSSWYTVLSFVAAHCAAILIYRQLPCSGKLLLETASASASAQLDDVEICALVASSG